MLAQPKSIENFSSRIEQAVAVAQFRHRFMYLLMSMIKVPRFNYFVGRRRFETVETFSLFDGLDS